MLFWKLDEETIRCLINRDEIGQMGFDLDTLAEDHLQMDEFLDTIVRHSKNYLDWNTDNGIQTYAASPLPADQFLITISCTFVDDMIDKDLDQILRMTRAMSDRITEDRIEEIYSLSGEEKEEAFRDLAHDLHEVCSGNPDDDDDEDMIEPVEIMSWDPAAENKEDMSKENSRKNTRKKSSQEESDSKGLSFGKLSGRSGNYRDKTREKNSTVSRKEDRKKSKKEDRYPAQKLSFHQFSGLLDFISVLGNELYFPSSLYKNGEDYILLVTFPDHISGRQASSFVLTAEEYGAVCSNQKYDKSYFKEHGRLLIPKDGIRILSTMGHKSR